jgi:hypothetical protein
MKIITRLRIGTIAIFAAHCLCFAAEETKPPVDETSSEMDAWIEIIKEVYERTLESSGKLTGEVKTWLRSDLRKIGTWEYRVVEFPLGEIEALEKSLNELGAERWECFYVVAGQDKIRFFLKKPGFSYLKAVPSDDILRLFPKGE